MEFLALLLPVLIDLVNRKVADTDFRFWISVLICAVAGVGLNYLQTSFSFATPLEGFESLTQSIMVVFGLAQLSYKGFWENSKMRENLSLKSQ